MRNHRAVLHSGADRSTVSFAFALLGSSAIALVLSLSAAQTAEARIRLDGVGRGVPTTVPVTTTTVPATTTTVPATTTTVPATTTTVPATTTTLPATTTTVPATTTTVPATTTTVPATTTTLPGETTTTAPGGTTTTTTAETTTTLPGETTTTAPGGTTTSLPGETTTTVVTPTSTTSTSTTLPGSGVCDQTIDFEGFEEGEIVFNISGDSENGIHVHAANPVVGEDTNSAVIFDSSCPGGCSGKDKDLGTPNEDFGGPGVGEGGQEGGTAENTEPLGNVLIADTSLKDEDGDGLVDDPNDQAHEEVTFELDFSDHGSVVLRAITILDIETNEGSPGVALFEDSEGDALAQIPIPPTGDNGVVRVEFPRVEGATLVEITVFGSAAIDDIEYELDCDDDDECTEDSCGDDGACLNEPIPDCGGTTTTVGGSTTTLDGATTTTVAGGSTTTLPDSGVCGDADGDGNVTARDALLALKAAVGSQRACARSTCDVDSSASVTAADALRVLQAAVGGSVELSCA